MNWKKCLAILLTIIFSICTCQITYASEEEIIEVEEQPDDIIEEPEEEYEEPSDSSSFAKDVTELPDIESDDEPLEEDLQNTGDEMIEYPDEEMVSDDVVFEGDESLEEIDTNADSEIEEDDKEIEEEQDTEISEDQPSLEGASTDAAYSESIDPIKGKDITEKMLVRSAKHEDGMIVYSTAGFTSGYARYEDEMLSSKNGFTLSFDYKCISEDGGADGISLHFETSKSVFGSCITSGDSYCVDFNSFVSSLYSPHEVTVPHVGIIDGQTNKHIKYVEYSQLWNSDWNTIVVQYEAEVLSIFINGCEILTAQDLILPDDIYLTLQASQSLKEARRYVRNVILDYDVEDIELDPNESEQNPENFIHTLDYYAKTPSTVYNPELACDLMKLAWDAYGPNTKPNSHNVGTDEDIKADYKSLGFDVDNNYFSKNYPKWKYMQNYCAFSVAVKDIENEGQLVAITTRGTVGGFTPFPSPEWLSNLLNTVPQFTGVDSWHMGFYAPAKEIVELLEEKGLIETTNTKYFITGHSRGAGVGNVLAVLLSEKGISKENLYDYNFACPDTRYAKVSTDWSGDGAYDNIFNINAANDLVGVVPGIFGNIVGEVHKTLKPNKLHTPSNWGKYGNTYFYSFDWDSIERSVINIITFIGDQGPTNPHQPSLYYDFLSKKNAASSFKSYADAKVQEAAKLSKSLLFFAAFCPVDVTIIDSEGSEIASVVDGVTNYNGSYDLTDVIVMTDGDFKAFFVDPSIDCKVKIKATDSGNMAFVSGLTDANLENIVDEKHFENVKLETGKTFLAEGLSQASADNVKLYTVNSNGSKTAEISQSGKETAIKNNNSNKEKTVSKPKSITPSVILSKNAFTYSGKAQKPSVVVKDGNTVLKNTDYTVTYSGDCTNIGTHTVKVTLKGKYTGSATGSFTIVPKRAKISKLKAGKKKATIKWKKQKNITGYQIQYSLKKDFSSKTKTVTIKKAKTTSKKIKKLKSKKKYYFRIRTYKTVNGIKYYSDWSKAKKVKIK